MIQRISLTLFATLITLTFSGCVEKIVYVPEPYPVPSKCKNEKVKCSWQGSDAQVAEGMLKCIIDQKKVLEAGR